MWIIEKTKKSIMKRKITFKTVTEEWLQVKKRTVKQSTYANYRYGINKYLLPKFEKFTIKALENYDFNKFIDELKQDYSPKTVRDIITKLKAILYYIQNEYGANIKTKQIISPQLEQEPLIIFNKRETNKLEKFCLSENSLKSLGIVISLNMGLRIGELCALQWKNIDLDKREIKVRNTLQRIYDEKTGKTKIIIDTPKSKKSLRNIPISNKLYEALKNIKNQANDESFFLTGEINQFIEPRTYENIYKDILKKAKIKKKYNFHITRHTFATNCIEAGMDIKSLSELLGHSSVEITLNKYVHSSYKTKKKYLEKL